MSANTQRMLAFAALAACVLAGVFALAPAGDPKGTPRAEPGAQAARSYEPSKDPVPADVTALLGGLRVGDVIRDWVVVRIAVEPAEKQIVIMFDRNDSGFSVWVSKLGSSKPAPTQTTRYALYVGGVRAYGAPVPPAEPELTLQEILARVQANEGGAAVPAGI